MRCRGLWLPAAVLLVAAPAAPAAAQPAFAGPEIRVTPIESDLFTPHVAMAAHPGGGVTAVWEYPFGVTRARRSDPRVQTLGREIEIGFSSYPGVAAVGSGFVVVGLGEGEERPFDRARLFDAAGRPRGGSFPVGTPVAPVHSSLRVASDRGGNFAVVWRGLDPQTGRNEVFLRRFSATGAPRGEPVRILRAPLAEPLMSASVARAPDGEILVTWSEGNRGHVFGQLFGRFGDPVGEPFLIDDRLGAQAAPAAAFATDGGFLVAWQGWVTDDYRASECLWGRWYDRGGLRARGGRFRIDLGSDLAAGDPRLVPGAHGAILAAWATWNSLHLRQIEADGSLGPELTSRRVRPRAGEPWAVAGWGEGELALLWGRSGRVGWIPRDLALQRFATVSSPGVLRLERSRAVAPEEEGQIQLRVERWEGNLGAVSASYTVLARSARAGEDFRVASGTVAFPAGDSTPRLLSIPLIEDDLPEGDETLVLALSDPSGGAVLGTPAKARIEIRDDDVPSSLLAAGPPFEVALSGGWGQRTNPSVTALAGGGLLFTWDDEAFSSWPPHLGSLLLGPDGTQIASSFWPAGRARLGRACAHPGGGFTLTADGFTEGVRDSGTDQEPEPTGAAGQRFDALGRPVGPALTLPSAPLDLAAGPAGGFLALSLGPVARGRAIFLTAYSRLGRPLAPPVRTDRTPFHGEPQALPSFAADPGRGGMVVWRSALDTGDRILARRIDAAGRPVGEEITIAARPGGLPDRPAVTLVPGGGYLVAWEDEDGEGSGIFVRRLSPAGAPLGEILQVNSHPTGDQVFPRIAAARDGRFLVVWETPGFDDRPRLAAQLFAAQGARLGSEIFLDPEIVGITQTEADIAVPAAGGFLVVWRRTVLGEGSFIYGQRLTCR